jgi:hypothetical protein
MGIWECFAQRSANRTLARLISAAARLFFIHDPLKQKNADKNTKNNKLL